MSSLPVQIIKHPLPKPNKIDTSFTTTTHPLSIEEQYFQNSDTNSIPFSTLHPPSPVTPTMISYETWTSPDNLLTNFYVVDLTVSNRLYFHNCQQDLLPIFHHFNSTPSSSSPVGQFLGFLVMARHIDVYETGTLLDFCHARTVDKLLERCIWKQDKNEMTSGNAVFARTGLGYEPPTP